ncbi:hypothetical protein LTR36_002875 [Oleoguttula mirabilis]|uniref:Uncharacterized protein n=1 Tax=Oleoguttula mirabilis TaxID=1507867 RepID=A0AAV9JJX7_9PEZI|nr:hypothetical protein LTR36_002875 [Oleoguttula mirabilis]
MPYSESEHTVDSQQNKPRTTLTGKPLVYQHDPMASLMFADVGFVSGVNAAGANLLPHGYTDNSLVRIPIKASDVDGGVLPIKPAERKGGIFRKLSSAFKDKSDGDFKIVMMSRGDYLKYWAKGEDGHFLSSVETPPDGRKEWVRKQLELNEQWKRDTPSLANKPH